MSVEEKASANALLPVSPLPRLLVALVVNEETRERSSETSQGLARMSFSRRYVDIYLRGMSLFVFVFLQCRIC